MKRIWIAEISFDVKGEKFPFLAEGFSCVEILEAMAVVIIIICKKTLILKLHLETIKPKPGSSNNNADLHKQHWLFHFHSLLRYIYFSDISLTGIDCTIIAYFFGPLAVNLEVTRVKLARPPLSALTSHYAGEAAAMTTTTDVS